MPVARLARSLCHFEFALSLRSLVRREFEWLPASATTGRGRRDALKVSPLKARTQLYISRVETNSQDSADSHRSSSAYGLYNINITMNKAPRAPIIVQVGGCVSVLHAAVRRLDFFRVQPTAIYKALIKELGGSALDMLNLERKLQ